MSQYFKSPLSWKGVSVLILLQSLLLLGVAIGSDSLWVDEFVVPDMIHLENLGAWWHWMTGETGSHAQMPLYFLYMFFWIKICGVSEYVLRLANWPLFLVGEVSLLWLFRGNVRYFIMLFLAISFSPFIWYYLDEARPYLMMFLGASLGFNPVATLYTSISGTGRIELRPMHYWMFAAGTVILCGSSMLGVPWAIASMLFIAYLIAVYKPVDVLVARAYIWPGVVMFLCLLPLAIYYAGTLMRGAGGTHAEATSLQTLAFSAYELVGLAGIGPGRLELRSQGPGILRDYAAPLLLASTVFAFVLVNGFLKLLNLFRRRDVIVAIFILFIPVVLTISAGYFLHWRVLGRHFMPLMPFLLLLFALGLSSMLQGSGMPGRLVALLTILALGYSSIGLRIFDRHGKDNFSSASQYAVKALEKGETVMWTPFPLGADYYGVPAKIVTASGVKNYGNNLSDRAVLFAENVENMDLLGLPVPDLVIVSRPADEDKGALKSFLEAHHYSKSGGANGFSYWRK